jgi:hypothetical protein
VINLPNRPNNQWFFTAAGHALAVGIRFQFSLMEWRESSTLGGWHPE